MINNLNERQIQLLLHMRNNAHVSFSILYSQIKRVYSVSEITLKRDISELVKLGYLKLNGKARTTTYDITSYGLMNTPINSMEYVSKDPDERGGYSKYNFSLLSQINFEIFSFEEIDSFNRQSIQYTERQKIATQTIRNKELERFIIEFSWKSSAIEGNTYNLLDTEKLIKEKINAEGKSVYETTMILNHKKTFDYILKNNFNKITTQTIIQIHELLTQDMSIVRGIRKSLVGITSSTYTPLHNEFQIKEALEDLCNAIEKQTDIRSKALLAIIGISYIQPFEDGNKRTARMIGNLLLVKNNLPPLSYRSTPVEEYRASVLSFYELNSLVPFKKIFTEQYNFSANNYTVK